MRDFAAEARRKNRIVQRVTAAAALLAAVQIGVAYQRLVRSAIPVQAQAINAGQPAPPKGGHVSFVAEAESVTANQPGMIHLHFKVDPGFHINSHTPKSDMLIPTKIAVLDQPGVETTDVDFPAGTPYSFAFEPKTKLDVYTGDVTLTAHVKAKPGTYVMKAALHYQACDQAACYPPKTLNIEQPFTAK